MIDIEKEIEKSRNDLIEMLRKIVREGKKGKIQCPPETIAKAKNLLKKFKLEEPPRKTSKKTS